MDRTTSRSLWDRSSFYTSLASLEKSSKWRIPETASAIANTSSKDRREKNKHTKSYLTWILADPYSSESLLIRFYPEWLSFHSFCFSSVNRTVVVLVSSTQTLWGEEKVDRNIIHQYDLCFIKADALKTFCLPLTNKLVWIEKWHIRHAFLHIYIV